MWSWQRAHLSGIDRNVSPTPFVTSSRKNCRVSAATLIPVCSHGPERRKPVAILISGSCGASSSPAICSRMNRSYGLSRLRHAFGRSKSFENPLVSA